MAVQTTIAKIRFVGVVVCYEKKKQMDNSVVNMNHTIIDSYLSSRESQKTLTVNEYPNKSTKKSKLRICQKKKKRARRKALQKNLICVICHEPCLQKTKLCKQPLHIECREKWK